MSTSFILGVDLGQAHDYTALTVLERSVVPTGKTRKVTRRSSSIRHGDGRVVGGNYTEVVPITENHYQCRHLERLPLGTSYPTQVTRVRGLYDKLLSLPAFALARDGLRYPVKPTIHLVVDQTGVGRPVIDMLRAAGLEPIAVTITGGDTVTQDGRDYRVPKRDLVAVAQVLLQSERLKIASSLAEAQTLVSELLAFKVSISLKGHDSYGNDVGLWREAPNDDMVLAVALAAWWGERPRHDLQVPKAKIFQTAH